MANTPTTAPITNASISTSTISGQRRSAERDDELKVSHSHPLAARDGNEQHEENAGAGGGEYPGNAAR